MMGLQEIRDVYKLTSLGETKWVTLTGKVSPGTGSGGNTYEGKPGMSRPSSS